jgi:glycosyltransferase involved in cell wall biosynthesis
MNVYLTPQKGLSRAMTRVANALVQHAPAHVTVVHDVEAADLVILHVIGYPETEAAVRAARARGQQYALIQYCIRSTQRPHTSDWATLWSRARCVWSYYDLRQLCAEDGTPPPRTFVHAPLGVDSTMFWTGPGAVRDLLVLTSGYVPEAESVLEVHEAAQRVGGRVVHVGPPDDRFGDHVVCVHGVPDHELVQWYRRVQFVTGLRRVEGFELPAAEGLLCGARPVLFDAPHYRQWFGPWAEYVEESDPAALVDDLVRVFRTARSVSDAEREAAADAFSWQRVCTAFWDAVGSVPAAPKRAKRRPSLLWIGDAACSTGFARVTHNVLDRLVPEYDVTVLGINYIGDPHPHPYPIFPCYPGGDVFGYGRVKQLVEQLRPDVVVLLNDTWNVPAYLDRIGKAAAVVATMPVDGHNVRGRALNRLDAAVFWTQFGLNEARGGGYTGPAEVIPLGVDLDTFQPVDKRAAREALGLPSECFDAFIVGNVNRNQPRKRLDLTIAAFATWVRTHKIRDAYLFLHVAPTGELAYDVKQLAEYFHVANRLILVEPEIRHGVNEARLALTYCAFDVQLSTTQGEGWGLPTLEGMACGVPQIVPDWSALGEWARGAAYLVECVSIAATPSGINMVGGVVDPDDVAVALHAVYENAALRDRMRERSLALAHEERFRWDSIAEKYAEVLAVRV